MTLRDKLYEKLNLENEQYLAGLLTEAPQEIIDSAHKIMAMEAILGEFGREDFISESQAKNFLKKNCTLQDFYEEWCYVDAHPEDIIRGWLKGHISEMS